jgi:hypothetical protein
LASPNQERSDLPYIYVIDASGTIAVSEMASDEHLKIGDIGNQHLDAARKQSRKD